MYAEAATIDIGLLKVCPICRSYCYQDEDPRGMGVLYICPTCGKFILGSMCQDYVVRLDESGRSALYKFSFAMRTVSENAKGKRDNSLFSRLSIEDAKKILNEPDPTVQDKLSLLLKYLGNTTRHPGQVNEFDSSHDYSVICAQNAEEALFYFDSLVEQGLLKEERPFTGSALRRFKVSAAGWHELNRIGQAGTDSSNAFIAMSFDPSRDSISLAISAAVKAAGYKPIRVDQVEHVNRIDDEIVAQIRNSKFLISDFTGQRNGVYFEAGFMLGLGRTVIWLCEHQDLKNVHFDTRQYNTIAYSDAADLQKRLQVRIEALLGKGPYVTG